MSTARESERASERGEVQQVTSLSSERKSELRAYSGRHTLGVTAEPPGAEDFEVEMWDGPDPASFGNISLLVADGANINQHFPEAGSHAAHREREFFIDNLLVRIHRIIVMIRWTCLAPWEFEFPFPGSLTSTFLVPLPHIGPRRHFCRILTELPLPYP